MSNVNLPEIPDVPDGYDEQSQAFFRAVKETLEVLTGRVGGNDDLIEYMESTICPKCGA